MKRLVKLFFIYLFVFISSAWSCAALHFAMGGRVSQILLWVFVCSVLISLILKSRYTVLRYYPLAAFLLVLAWWLSLKPTNEKAWQIDVAKMPYATFSGPRVTVHNIRNTNYKSEHDYEVSYYDKTYSLDELRSTDLVASYWGLDLIAHLFLTFGFSDGSYLAISAETRKQVGQEYDAVAGFFRNYSLIYVVADEKDLIGVRTNYRNEDVYLYRLNISPQDSKEIFISYLKRINRLAEHPEFYNSLIDNCTTNIISNIRESGLVPRPSRAWILTGLIGEVIYNRRIARGADQFSFAEFQAKSRINEYALANDKGTEFSKTLREHLPFADNYSR